MDLNMIVSISMIGIGATFATDVWALILKHVFKMVSLNFCMLGRWILHMPAGTFRHANIHHATPKPLECAVGWVAHYLIGIVFALVFVSIVSVDWLSQPTLLPAVIFGLCTVVMPLFIMQPAFGFGIAASKSPQVMQARIRTFSTHLVFGLGLYISALFVS